MKMWLGQGRAGGATPESTARRARAGAYLTGREGEFAAGRRALWLTADGSPSRALCRTSPTRKASPEQPKSPVLCPHLLMHLGTPNSALQA